MTWQKLPLKGFIYYSLAINFLTAAIIIFCVYIKILPPVAPLFYGLPTGVNQLAESWKLLLVPFISASITLLNILLTKITEDLFLKKTLMITAAFIATLSTITIIKIILLIGFI